LESQQEQKKNAFLLQNIQTYSVGTGVLYGGKAAVA
jgi:hypothetical protein